MHALLPHPSKLVMATLTGAQIFETLERSAASLETDPLQVVGGLIQTSGIRWTLDFTRPPGQRVRDVRFGEAPPDPAKRYSVATQPGMLAGIHRYDAYARGQQIARHKDNAVDAVGRAVRHMRTVLHQRARFN